jgi:signal peptidase I
MRPPSFGRWLGQILVLVAIGAVIALGLRTFAVQFFDVPSSSMEPTLLIGDRIAVNMSAYRVEEPRRGDIVVFKSSTEASKDLVKRVVAVGGDTIDIQDGVVTVNGRRLTEPYVNKQYPDHYTAMGPVKVPAGTVYVMGDNRANSSDSRYIGPQPVPAVLGRVFAVVWPLSRIRLL